MNEFHNNMLDQQQTIADSAVAIELPSPDILADLPPSNTQRWVVRRKEQVVQAVQAGRLTREQACHYYHLSDEEYQSWEDHLSQHGLRGLRVTRLQDYRRPGDMDTAVTRRRA